MHEDCAIVAKFRGIQKFTFEKRDFDIFREI